MQPLMQARHEHAVDSQPPAAAKERSHNGLRLAKVRAGSGVEISVFLLADVVTCAKAGPKVPQGFYNLGLMEKAVTRKGEVLLRGTRMDARCLGEGELVEGTRRGTLDELADRTLAAGKVLVF